MDRHAPHSTNPSRASVRVVLAYKNFASKHGISHIGLGVAAMNTSATLRRLGFWVDVWPCASGDELEKRLVETQAAAMRDKQHPVSHVVVSAPWIATDRFQAMLMRHPGVDFAVVSHSNIGFLMADPNGIRLLREACELSIGNHNFTVAGNCRKFCDAWDAMYGVRPRWLPNLYDVSTIRHVGQRKPWAGAGTLNVGVFGATRPLKNQVTAVAAAIEIAARNRAEVVINVNSGRAEGGGSVGGAIEQLVAGLSPHVRLQHVGWRTWPAFRQVVAKMHVLLSPSYTESFCMVVADGIAEGVASVVAESIDWVPKDWVANADDTNDVAKIAGRLLHDQHAVDRGQAALREYVKAGTPAWTSYLLKDGQ